MSTATDEALELLAISYRVNLTNMRQFERRLGELAEIGRELRAGNCSPSTALDRAEELGFIAPLVEGAG